MLVCMFSMVTGLCRWWPWAGNQTYRPNLFEHAKSQILLPMGAVLLWVLVALRAQTDSPVPLSVPLSVFSHEWKNRLRAISSRMNVRVAVWHNGDQDFYAQRADKIYVAFRIFSPTMIQ